MFFTFSKNKISNVSNKRFFSVFKKSPLKSIKKLKKGKVRISGRNNYGRTTIYHRGGGNKTSYRFIDWKRSLFSTEGIVVNIEYDPNRTGKIALILYKNGVLSYILCPKDLKIGDKIQSTLSKDFSFKTGISTPIKNLRTGTLVHNIELKPGKGGQIMRSAGSYAKIIKKDLKNNVIIKLTSGKIYTVPGWSMATVGIVSNDSHQNKKYSKAGNRRWLGRRPTVRGVAKNPVDHPHGGGEGKSKGGRHPVTPWGKLTKGSPTSFLRKTTNILLKRKNNI